MDAHIVMKYHNVKYHGKYNFTKHIKCVQKKSHTYDMDTVYEVEFMKE